MARLFKLRISLLTAALAALGLGLALFAVGANHSSTSSSAVLPVTGGGGSTATTVASGSTPETVYNATNKGVVSIVSTTSNGQQGSFPFGGSGQSSALGSGIVLDNQGHILTNEHVVDGATKLTVSFGGKPAVTRTATVVGTDASTDLAVIKVDPSGLNLQPLTLGDSSAVQVGDTVYALGNPFGYTDSFSEGIVSGLDRSITAPNGFGIDGAIQTDASINPGNSGGPLLDANGRVVGINAQIATNQSTASGEGSSSGVGFAIPINTAKTVIAALEKTGHVSHAYLGVSSTSASSGAQVQSVQSGSPADQAGIQAGDVITAVDGSTVATSDDLASAISAHKPGDKVTVTLTRGGSRMSKTVTLGTQPSQAPNG